MVVRQRTTPMLRGKRARVTSLDTAGRVQYGDNNAVVTKGFSNFSLTTNTEEGEAINLTNANGEACINESAVPSFVGVAIEAEFCNADYAFFNKVTGQKVVFNDDGEAVGITESTDVDLSTVRFALEIWVGAQSGVAARDGAEGEWGYVLLPNVGGGVLGDYTIENDGITFTLTGMTTKNAGAWGAGPYNVELVEGVAAPLFEPLLPNDHRRLMTVEIAPPEPYAGSIPVLDPTDPALTGLTTTPTGLSVLIAPTPAGTDPVWYTFGDGQWDYAETGTYTHVYDAPGTYTITGKRGTSTFSTNVTVTA